MLMDQEKGEKLHTRGEEEGSTRVQKEQAQSGSLHLSASSMIS